jgi:oligopeptide transport system substrate-binding protein
LRSSPARTRLRSRPLPRLPGRREGRSGNHFLLIAVVLAATGTLAAVGSGLEDAPEPGGGGGGSPAQREAARGGARLTIAWAEPPASLDPALAVDHTGVNVVWNLFDPLVRLGPSGEPVAGAAESWRTDRGGRRIVFRLRAGARWTNGEPVTAHDFEYAWERVLDPETASPHAARLGSVAGAAALRDCAGAECGPLAAALGIRARSDRELEVTLASPRPSFVVEAAHSALVPVHRETVQRFGERWTEAENIVTNGAFSLAELNDDSFSLVRNPDWHGAGNVTVGRVVGRFVADARARVQAFDEGVVLALDGGELPSPDLPALREREEYERYPAFGTYAFAFNLASIEDVHQRRAMALAIDREAIAEHVLQEDVAPATRFTPPGLARLALDPPDSPWLPPDGDLEAAREELEEATRVEERITLLHVDAPGNAGVADAVADAWRDLGIETRVVSRAPDEYLQFAGPLSAESVDVYQLEVRYPAVDARAVLADWTCDAAGNKTNFCDERFDSLFERARTELDAAERERLYVRAEEVLSGAAGDVPAAPVFWPTHTNLESLKVKRSFTIDPLGRIDFSAVRVR